MSAKAPSELQPPTRGSDFKSCHTSKRMSHLKNYELRTLFDDSVIEKDLHALVALKWDCQRLNTQDRLSSLRNRVAELEGEIGENPHFVGYEDKEMHHQLDGISPESSHPCNPIQGMQQCSCVQDARNYQIMLELSLRLRKAVAILAQYPHHQAGGYCPLNQTLVELDTLTASIRDGKTCCIRFLGSVGVIFLFLPQTKDFSVAGDWISLSRELEGIRRFGLFKSLRLPAR
ncbi:hypothetical protein BT96DRAFT_942809 [Gymnopus androsaceus JB14]|uniref:Uncharacterized protein n=1 Tax=Gymnopus androsaceus JB14 TaxID=1447944 RepID=A0A6A4H9D3_9AGAR|nr:hypothetical protein BT96DRAFT_942809 [Gymnopus androsaceus JB14]